MPRSNGDRMKTFSSISQLKGTGLERRSFMRRLVGGGAAVTVGSTLAGCSDDDGDMPNELELARAGDGDNLDPHDTTMAYSSYVMSLIYDPLMVLDFDNEPSPAVGDGWEISDDGTEWTIGINDGIEFHNGDPLTADDVVFTFERFMDMSPTMWAAGTFYDVEETDDMEVTFYFEEPYAPWEVHTTSSYFGIIPRGPVEDDPDEFAINPIGSGPYEIDEWIQDDRVVLERNDNWNTPTFPGIESEDPPEPERLIIRTIPEDTPRIQELRTGDIDMIIDDLPSREVDQLEGDAEVEVSSDLSNFFNYVMIHNELAPTDELEVRQAMAYAINRDQIVNDIYDGYAEINHAPVSENLPWWAGEELQEQGLGFEYDPDRARELLEEAGWEDTGGEYRERNGETLSIEMVGANAPSEELQTSEEIMSMLTEVGFDVDLTPYESTTAYAIMEDGETNAMFAGLGWFETSIMEFLLHSDNIPTTNRSRFDDAEVDSLLDQAAQTVDQEEREELYLEAQIRAMEQVACIPIQTPYDHVAMQQDLSGFRIQPQTLQHVFHDVTME